jgi:hypothetical protein
MHQVPETFEASGNILLDKYASSKAFRSGESSRRIMVHLSKVKVLKRVCENVDSKELPRIC